MSCHFWSVELIYDLKMIIRGFKASTFDKKTKFAIISPYHAYCPFSQLVRSRHATPFVQMRHIYKKYILGVCLYIGLHIMLCQHILLD